MFTNQFDTLLGLTAVFPLYNIDYVYNNIYMCCIQVTGNTVFNMIRFNEILTDKDDRPIGEPPKIIKTEVIMHSPITLTSYCSSLSALIYTSLVKYAVNSHYVFNVE